MQQKYFLPTSMLISFFESLLTSITHYRPWAWCFFSLAGWDTVNQNQNLYYPRRMYQWKKDQGDFTFWKIITFLLISWAICKIKDSIFLYFFSSWFTVKHSFFLRFSMFCLRTWLRFINTPGGRPLLLQQQNLDYGVNLCCSRAPVRG